MATNAANVFIGGSDLDALYIGAPGVDLSAFTLSIDLSEVADLIDVGWLNDDGHGRNMSDSVKKLTGHQGTAPIRTTMESSSMSLSAVLLESKIETYKRYYDATVTTSGTGEDRVAEIKGGPSRRIVPMVAVWDSYDADDPAIHWRYFYDLVELGERGEVVDKRGEFTAYSWALEVIGDWRALTNHPGMLNGS